jgi:hypothetical protein
MFNISIKSRCCYRNNGSKGTFSSSPKEDILKESRQSWFACLTILAPGTNLPPMKSLKDYSMVELRQVISIKEQIEALQNQLAEFSGELGNGLPEPPTAPPRRKMSAAARRKIGLAQKARWAKQKRY